jgi:hypothetical protein
VPTAYWNTEQVAVVNCTPPAVGPSATATIPAGDPTAQTGYSSTVSQAAANAAAYVAAVAQANLQLVCTVPTPPPIVEQFSGLLWQLPIISGSAVVTGSSTISGSSPVTLIGDGTTPVTVPVVSSSGFDAGQMVLIGTYLATVVTVNPSNLSVTSTVAGTIPAGSAVVTSVTLGATEVVVPLSSVGGFAASALVGGVPCTIVNNYPASIGVTSTIVANIPVGANVYALVPQGPGSGSVCPLNCISSEVAPAGQLYNVTLLIRGIIEMKNYGNTISGTLTGTCLKSNIYIPMSTLNEGVGGIDQSNPSNEYCLVIADPSGAYSATYFLNVVTGSAAITPRTVDFQITIQLPPGATVTLAAYSIDNAEYPNNNPALTFTPATGEPALSALIGSQPVSGQFLQLDALNTS